MKWRFKKGGERFLYLPYPLLNSQNYQNLSGSAVKLLCDIGVQFNGKNNGDLQATWTYMKGRGWKSRDTLTRAIKELLYYGVIEKTRQGGLEKCCLYALTWYPIDDPWGKLDCQPTKAASRLFKEPKKPMTNRSKKRNASTETSHIDPTFRVEEQRSRVH